MKKRSVVVIGAGIAGLSAAVYLQRSGFDVTIYEQHEIPGGLSTSWSRKGYLFEGGMHWLTGSSEKLVLNRVWKETGALKENNPVRYREPLYTLIDEKTEIRLYRDIDKMRKEFIDAAPEDRKAIEGLCRDIKTFLPVHFVLRDIPWIKTKSPTIPTLKELLPMAPAAIPALYLRNVSYDDYLSRFKNKKLRALLHSVIGTRFNALSLVYTLASFASGDCGYPEGGSLRLAQNIADTFASLGGKIVYRTKVLGIVTERQRISGVKIARTKAGASPYTADGFDHSAENSETEIVKSDFVVA
ncbi:phytoene desaturase family protein, partial [Treponema socranskii]